MSFINFFPPQHVKTDETESRVKSFLVFFHLLCSGSSYTFLGDSKFECTSCQNVLCPL